MCGVASANIPCASICQIFACNVNVELDGDNPDLFLDCFASAVKSGDMELAAKIAGELYRMDLSDAQKKRFADLEDKISRKDYQTYRDYLRNIDAKSSTVYDEESVTNDDGYDVDANSFVGDIYDAISEMYGMIDSLGNDGRFSYERHDTLDGGFFDMFFDVYTGGANDDSIENKNAAENVDINSALDEYEKYVNKAVESLRRMFEGGESAWSDFEKYSNMASDVAENLEKSTSEMTKAQFKRFMRIFEKMITGLF